MYVCICNNVTDKDIRRAADCGVCDMDVLSEELKVGTCCGKCKNCARNILRKAMRENSRAHVNFGLTPASLEPALP